MNLRLHIFFGQLLWLIAVLNGKSLQGVPGYGRNLIIKALPAVEDYQSNVYEVYMEPYLYDLGQSVYPLSGSRTEKQIDLAFLKALEVVEKYAKRKIYNDYLVQANLESLEHRRKAPHALRATPGLQAVAHLTADEESGVTGDLIFTQIVPNGPVTIEGNVTGLSPGLHGIHVHQTGDIKDNCKEIGPHFVAYYGRHGGPRDHIRHVGDLGNIKAEEGATVNVKIIDHLISLAGPRSIVGRSLAISKGEDDYGKSSTEDSALTGTSGPTIACGVIGYLN